MKVFKNINDFNDSNFKIVLTLGMYDGVHYGHQVILNKIVDRAKEIEGKSVLLTFSPHPREVLQKGIELKMLSLENEKLQLLEKSGIDYIIIHPFTKEFSRLTSTDFIRNLLVDKIGINELIIGYDHHFGRDREGSFSELEKSSEVCGFNLIKVEAQNFSNIAVSSTKIRNALNEGDILKANKLLNYNYSLEGVVIHGDKIGRTLSFPTANLFVNKDKLIPGNGVYLFESWYINKHYYGLVNIGTRPTLNSEENRIEAFLFNFNADIYDKNLRITFLQKIRDEFKFNSVEELKKQIQIDCENAEFIIKKMC